MTLERFRRGARLPRIAGAVLGLSIVWFVAAQSGDLSSAVARLASLGPATLPAGLGLVVLGILTRGVQARAAYRFLGLPARLGPMVELSASSNATGKVVKSAGVAGLVPFLTDARHRGHSRAKVVAAYVSIKLVETISFCVLVAVAVLACVTAGGLHGAALLGALVSLAYALVVGAGLVVLGSRRTVARALAERSRQIWARLLTIFRRPAPAESCSAAHELVDAIDRLRSDRGPAARLLFTAIAGKVIGAATLLVVLVGLGVHLGLSTIVLVYALTLMASMIGPLPAGVGAAEASLGALLIAHGVATPTTAAAVLAFRFLDLWLPLLAGALAALVRSRRLRHRRALGRNHGDSATAPRVSPSTLAAMPIPA
jgi:uncharacterized protein (TIRG00374 family)